MARHTFLCPLRWSDMDVYGIVNNVMYFRLLEEARVDLISRLGRANGHAFFEQGSVVVRQRIEYKQQLAHRHEPVEIETWVSNLQAATVDLECRIKDGEKIYALASTTMAPYDYGARRPRRLTPAERSFFEAYLEERGAIA